MPCRRQHLALLRPVLALLALLTSSASLADPLLEDYAAHAVGRFSSAAQHRADPAYDEVTAQVVRLWADRDDGLWLYQEQTIRTGPQATGRPYFQRVGHVTVAGDGTLRRENLALRDPLRFAGYGTPGYRGPEITPADLGPAGCHNILTFVSPGFWTARTEDCANSYRGATRMESRALLTPNAYVNWDRGFGAAGQHVWGPKKGGYVFDRVP
jgi:hypothetical protein